MKRRIHYSLSNEPVGLLDGLTVLVEAGALDELGSDAERGLQPLVLLPLRLRHLVRVLVHRAPELVRVDVLLAVFLGVLLDEHLAVSVHLERVAKVNRTPNNYLIDLQ